MAHLSKLIAGVFFFGNLTIIAAQTAIPASGGNASGGGGTVSYTIGQTVYTRNSGGGGSAAQGVQQPYEISVVTAIEQAIDINLQFTAYPNPTSNFLTLRVGNYVKESLFYWIYGVKGNLLQNKKVESDETEITMQNLSPGTYLLMVTDGGKEIKTFKIIKN
jgi:hypothetical protein